MSSLVLQVRDVSNGKTYALKHMRLMGDSEAIADCMTEINTLKALRHVPSVVSLRSVTLHSSFSMSGHWSQLLDIVGLVLMITANFGVSLEFWPWQIAVQCLVSNLALIKRSKMFTICLGHASCSSGCFIWREVQRRMMLFRKSSDLIIFSVLCWNFYWCKKKGLVRAKSTLAC